MYDNKAEKQQWLKLTTDARHSKPTEYNTDNSNEDDDADDDNDDDEDDDEDDDDCLLTC